VIRLLWDLPNAITLLGLMSAILGLREALVPRPEVALVFLLWAVMLDHLDGFVAKRMRRRNADAAKLGGDLDTLTDMITGGVVPAALVLRLGAPHGIDVAAAAMIVVLAGVRLAYYNNFGLTSDGRFHGVPVTYNAPTLALCYLTLTWLGAPDLGLYLGLTMMTLGVLHVSALRPPPVRGVGVLVYFAFATGASVALLCH
jgi:CDP-diacylglycerol--serine O-phosphatidyltransferase